MSLEFAGKMSQPPARAIIPISQRERCRDKMVIHPDDWRV